MQKEPVHALGINTSKRRVRFIIFSMIRIMLALIAAYAYLNQRNLVLAVSLIAFTLTFVPLIIKKLFHKEFPAMFDIILMSLIFGILAFWEIRGIYSNTHALALLMNFFEAVVVGLVGFTLVYTFFRQEQKQGNIRTISLFSFCLSFTIGTFLEMGEIAADSLFQFRIHDAGIYGTTGDLALYALGSLVVSLTGYYSLRQGKTILLSTFLEEFIIKNPKLFGSSQQFLTDPITHTKQVLEKGENSEVEFKSTLRKNIHTNAMDKSIEHAVLKTLNAYMNTQGGTLLIGVSDKKEILGLDHDQFSSLDQAHRHLMQLISDYLGPENIQLVDCQVIPLEDKHILKVECKRSPNEVFLKKGNEDEFFVRQGPLSKQLSGSDLLKYVESNFRNN